MCVGVEFAGGVLDAGGGQRGEGGQSSLTTVLLHVDAWAARGVVRVAGSVGAAVRVVGCVGSLGRLGIVIGLCAAEGGWFVSSDWEGRGGRGRGGVGVERM